MVNDKVIRLNLITFLNSSLFNSICGMIVSIFTASILSAILAMGGYSEYIVQIISFSLLVGVYLFCFFMLVGFILFFIFSRALYDYSFLKNLVKEGRGLLIDEINPTNVGIRLCRDKSFDKLPACFRLSDYFAYGFAVKAGKVQVEQVLLDQGYKKDKNEPNLFLFPTQS